MTSTMPPKKRAMAARKQSAHGAHAPAVGNKTGAHKGAQRKPVSFRAVVGGHDAHLTMGAAENRFRCEYMDHRTPPCFVNIHRDGQLFVEGAERPTKWHLLDFVRKSITGNHREGFRPTLVVISLKNCKYCPPATNDTIIKFRALLHKKLCSEGNKFASQFRITHSEDCKKVVIFARLVAANYPSKMLHMIEQALSPLAPKYGFPVLELCAKDQNSFPKRVGHLMTTKEKKLCLVPTI